MGKASYYLKNIGVSATLSLSFLFAAKAACKEDGTKNPVLDRNKTSQIQRVPYAQPLHRDDNVFYAFMQATDATAPDTKYLDTESLIRARIVEEAKSHLHVREQGGDNKGDVIDKYLRTDKVGKVSGLKAAPEGSAWCAGFVSHVLEQTVPGILRYSVVSKNLLWQAERKGAYEPLGSYTPQVGDLIFFERGKDGDWRGHVGVVYDVAEDGTITTIEGNKAHPDFQGDPNYKYDPQKPDGVRKVVYKPEDFKAARILGFGNVGKMITPDLAQKFAPKKKTPAPNMTPVSS